MCGRDTVFRMCLNKGGVVLAVCVRVCVAIEEGAVMNVVSFVRHCDPPNHMSHVDKPLPPIA